MGWFHTGKAFAVVLLGIAFFSVGCMNTSSAGQSCGGTSELDVTAETGPGWATKWVYQAGGAMGGGSVAVDNIDDPDDVFARIHTCVGLSDSGFLDVTDVGSTPAQRLVRIGVADYVYRAGEVRVGGTRYSVDIAVARDASNPVRFGIAFSPLMDERSTVDVYGGAFMVQQMRERGIF